MRTLTRGTFAGMMASLAMAPAARAQSAPTKVTVYQAVQTMLYLPFYVALDKGHFTKHGLDVTKMTAGSSANAIAAVISGSAMFSIQDPLTAGIARLKGAPLKDICTVVTGVPTWIVVRGDSSIKTLADLNGKTVTTAIPPATGTYLFQALMAKQNIKVTTNLVAIGTEPAPFLAGKTEAAVVISPQVDELTSQGGRVLYSFTNAVKDGWAFTGVTAQEQTLAQSAPAVQAFVAGMSDAMTAIRNDPAGAEAVAVAQFPTLAPALVSAAARRLIGEHVFPTSPVFTKAMFANALGLQESVGNIKPGTLHYEDLMDMSFAQTAAKTMADK